MVPITFLLYENSPSHRQIIPKYGSIESRVRMNSFTCPPALAMPTAKLNRPIHEQTTKTVRLIAIHIVLYIQATFSLFLLPAVLGFASRASPVPSLGLSQVLICPAVFGQPSACGVQCVWDERFRVEPVKAGLLGPNRNQIKRKFAR